MENKPIIEVENINMRFNLSEEKTDTLKEYFLKLMSGKLHFTEFYALRDINFTVSKGEAVALIGMNGSGKSTLLKVIAGIMYPLTGSVKVDGTIAPLIELGAGFDLELTARENIYLNGAVLGYSRDFIRKQFDEIVEFSELQGFIDVPVKNYSSGMLARLGFSIATCVRADILVVDEILAVGDFKFQQKCKKRMKDLMSGGTTLLFVSHSEDQVKELCPRSIWLDHGRLMADGETEAVYELYRKSMENATL